MYHLTPLYTQTTFKVSNSSLGIGLIPKEDSDYCKTTNRSFIYYSLFHPALEAGTRLLKSFTVYPNTHIFGLWSRLSTRVGGAGGGRVLSKIFYRRVRPKVVRLSEAKRRVEAKYNIQGSII